MHVTSSKISVSSSSPFSFIFPNKNPVRLRDLSSSSESAILAVRSNVLWECIFLPHSSCEPTQIVARSLLVYLQRFVASLSQVVFCYFYYAVTSVLCYPDTLLTGGVKDALEFTWKLVRNRIQCIHEGHSHLQPLFGSFGWEWERWRVITTMKGTLPCRSFLSSVSSECTLLLPDSHAMILPYFFIYKPSDFFTIWHRRLGDFSWETGFGLQPRVWDSKTIAEFGDAPIFFWTKWVGWKVSNFYGLCL